MVERVVIWVGSLLGELVGWEHNQLGEQVLHLVSGVWCLGNLLVEQIAIWICTLWVSK